MEPQLASLQAQLAQLQSSTPTPLVPIVPATQAISHIEPDEAMIAIRKMIKDEITAALKLSEVPLLKTYTFIEAVEEVLSTSDQQFLANLAVINALPAWMVSDGREQVQSIIKNFRTKYES